MTYEDFITKHNLHLDLTWKGFEVHDVGNTGNAWPCFKWVYEVRHQTQHSSSLTLRRDYTQGIGHGEFVPKLKAPNLGSLAYDPKVGLYFKLHSGGCYKVVQQGMEPRRGAPASKKIEFDPYFKFDDPDCRFNGPRFYVDRPTFPEILDSLRSDANCVYPTFEEFAAALGYDPDSRSAEKIYLACCEIERKLRGLVGWKGMVELLEEVERL